DDVYRFTHRAVQEFLAACHLARSPEELILAYESWRSDDGDRWREVLVLLLPCLRQHGQLAETGLCWLDKLAQRTDPAGRRKPVRQHWRDALLVADGYQECGGHTALPHVAFDTVRQMEGTLASALTQVFTPHAHATLNDRLRAGQ